MEEDSELEKDGVLIVRIKCSSDLSTGNILQKREELILQKLLFYHNIHKYDLIHDVGGFLYFSALRKFTLLTNVPLVSHLLILMKPYLEAIGMDPAKIGIFHELQMLQCQFSKIIITTSLNDKMLFGKNLNFNCTTDVLIYNTVEKPQIDEVSVVRWRKILQPNYLLFLFSARVNDENKGYRQARTLIEKLNLLGIKSKLVITDPSNSKGNFEKSESTIYLGRLKEYEYYALLSAIDVVICPSKYEAFGLVALEAAILNKPVIATNTGIHSEIFPKIFNGLLLEYQAFANVSQSSLRFIDNVILNKKNISEIIVNEIPYQFSHEYFCNQILNQYSKLGVN